MAESMIGAIVVLSFRDVVPSRLPRKSAGNYLLCTDRICEDVFLMSDLRLHFSTLRNAGSHTIIIERHTYYGTKVNWLRMYADV